MNRICMIMFIFCLFICGSALAQTANDRGRFDYGAFASLPVMHEGRLKPLETFAITESRRVMGHALPRDAAVKWLAITLFDPATASMTPVFGIDDPGLRHQLSLDTGAPGRFSLSDLGPGLIKTEPVIAGLMMEGTQATAGQKKLLRIHESSISLSQAVGTLSMVVPFEPAPGEKAETWLALRKGEIDLDRHLAEIVAAKGNDIDRYSAGERRIALTAMQMDMLRNAGKTNTLVRIMPPQWNDGEWLSPWQMLLNGRSGPGGAEYLGLWEQMAQAWRAGDSSLWQSATQEALDSARRTASVPDFMVEHLYNGLQPLGLAQVIYLGALLLLIVSIRFRPFTLQRAALLVAASGFVVHAAGIIMRIIILDRPPVGTLYESILFVSAVITICAILAERGRRDRIALGGGLCAGILLMGAAPAFAPDGDSMEMLVAVLNTGFWLATHVICITAGYGVSIMAGVIAHIGLLRKNPDIDGLLIKTLVCALFFTALGTMLGGIWADQSWGRFWGWDPKENGALLIVIWISWILHGHIGGQLRGAVLLASAAALNIIVALSWFGVNLLNVGLHSYGFTDSMAIGLAAFCILECIIIGASAAMFRRRGMP